MSDSVQPHRRQPTRLPHPWDSSGKNTGVGCHFLLQGMKVKLFSHVQPSVTTWTAAFQAPPSMGFSRQEYWSGVPLPSPYRIKQWQPTPVFLPGKSHGQRSLVGCSPWGCTESDMTKATSLSLFTFMHWRRKWQPTPVFLPGKSMDRGAW